MAGEAVGNTGDSIYNVFRSLKSLALLDPGTMLNAVARETGKARINNDNDSSNSCSSSTTANLSSEEIFYKFYF